MSDQIFPITFVIPLYNEDESIPTLLQEFETYWDSVMAKVVFVNDGSKDNTAQVISELCRTKSNYGWVDLSRNFGKEQAIAAGLSVVPDGQSVIVMDGDGQHTLKAVKVMIEHMANNPNADIVFGIREDREYQSKLDRWLSSTFYRILNRMLREPLDPRLGDFFIASPAMVATLKTFRDSKLFWKGIYSWVGFKRETVPIEIADRSAGKTSFNFFNRLSLGIDGIVWLTKVPLYIISLFGLIISLLSFITATYFIVQYIITGISVPGFYSLIVLEAFVGGVIMLSLGIIALYMAVIYENTSSRPGFLLSSRSQLPDWPQDEIATEKK